MQSRARRRGVVGVLRGYLFGAIVASGLSGCGTGAQRYGYNDNGVALHWNEISPAPAWDAYPVQAAVPVSMDQLFERGVKMLRVRVRAVDPKRYTINSEGVTAESSLALAQSTEELSGSPKSWTNGRACGEIDYLLRSCLDASQTDGVPNSSRCYWAPTPEEAVACWCRVCDFQRAIEICSVPKMYQTCDACQMGRSLQDWTQSRCVVGGAITVRANVLKGRNGVIEERWHGDVREVAQARLDARAQLRLLGSGDSFFARAQFFISAMLILALLVSIFCLAVGVPSSCILHAWVSFFNFSLMVLCKVAEALVVLCSHVSGKSPPGALIVLLRQASLPATIIDNDDGFISATSSVNNSPVKARKSRREAPLETPRDTYVSAPSSLTNTPQKPVRVARARATSSDSEHTNAASEQTDADGGEEKEGFFSAPTSPSKLIRERLSGSAVDATTSRGSMSDNEPDSEQVSREKMLRASVPLGL